MNEKEPQAIGQHLSELLRSHRETALLAVRSGTALGGYDAEAYRFTVDGETICIAWMQEPINPSKARDHYAHITEAQWNEIRAAATAKEGGQRLTVTEKLFAAIFPNR